MPTPYPVPRRFRFYALAGLGLLGLGTVALRPAGTAPDEVVRRLVQGVQLFYAEVRPEKAYLHLDQDAYAAGETVWFGAYVVDGQQHRSDSLSQVLHVELVSDRRQVVLRQALHLAGGRAPGALALPDTLAPGTYQLRAYTGWMRNAGPDYFYSRRLQVWPAPGSGEAGPSARAVARATAAAARTEARRLGAPPDVQFFPEGGNLVAGLESVVAFKAVDYSGRGLDVEGQVLDAQNQPVATFRSAHRGMGTFRLTPQPGQRYHAVVTGPRAEALVLPLPVAQASGYALRVTPEPGAFRVSIRQRGAAGGRVLLLAQERGAVGYVGQGEISGNDEFMVRIPQAKFAAGIVHFTVFDGAGAPQAERLAFAPGAAPLRVALAPDRADYGPREPVRLRVAVTDAAGQPVAAQLSLAVTDAAGAAADAETIASNLLLTSDLAGYVESPGYYFENPTETSARALDDLLLTQGWRRFAWKDVLAGQRPLREFGVEQSLGLLGRVVTPNGKPVPSGRLILLRNSPSRLVLPATTDDQGRFLFNGLGGCDTSRFTLQARTARGGRNLELRLDAGPPVPAGALPPLPVLPTPAEAAARQSSQAQVAAARRFRLDTAKTIVLSNVSVKAKKILPIDGRRLYNQGSATVLRMSDPSLAGSAYLTVFQMLQGRVAGVNVSGSEPNMVIQVRGPSTITGDNRPLFLLDGVPVEQDALSFFPARDVETIEVLKGPSAAIYGTRSANGVIAVYTRRGGDDTQFASVVSPGIMSVNAPGYACARQFYQPRYDRPRPAVERPDPRRRTLYWNPDVRTNAAGEAELTFYTADAAGRFQLVAQGVSAAGQPALGRGALQVAPGP
ncbi:TonB-dependent receptor plug domain-containing protein [Hymenobacter sp. PAMC 26628]|uniref:TonB-dependent receptor plug domain-containing protein n=1 Tax=Hymenobacter sp. PAMC 26628 TaxID=1484118 RepID=UPI0007701067|nr:TonB-dependent receptor plug domain-containing protein [Hymenobacter sp. PAMC 26628]AMJ64331.1 hypothetical protein AXW84_01980 [Hymenobacter sp. PAMC 26628]